MESAGSRCATASASPGPIEGAFSPRTFATADLPASLRPWSPPMKSQAIRGVCPFFALTLAVTCVIALAGSAV